MSQQRIQFLKDARGKEWRKGEVATLDRKLGAAVYLATLKNGEQVWVQEGEFILTNQLPLFELENDGSSKT